MSVISTCLFEYLHGKKLVFFGAGQYSDFAIRKLLPQISYFCDNNPSKHGTQFYGKPVYLPSKLLEEDPGSLAVIINTEYYREIAAQLFDMGISNVYSNMYRRANERIPKDETDGENYLRKKAKILRESNVERIFPLLADERSRDTLNKILRNLERGDFDFSGVNCNEPMYFNDIFKDQLVGDEVFADMGAYDGETVINFILYTRGKYKKIYAFEPDDRNFALMSAEIQDLRETVLINAGCYDAAGRTPFDARATMSSKILANAGDESASIDTVASDTIFKEPVTFIKMDIEGAEYKALLGAQRTIKACKPKLAISVYHKGDDLIKIPSLIREFVPEYRLFLRHHTDGPSDTVLYATV
jgi:FkbM family methyltransferase